MKDTFNPEQDFFKLGSWPTRAVLRPKLCALHRHAMVFFPKS